MVLTSLLCLVQTVLEREYAAYKRRHPDATDQMALSHVIKHSIPRTMPNTPGWHRKNLQVTCWLAI